MLMLLLLSCYVAGVSSSTCPWPCDPTSCPQLACQHGTVHGPCYCCDVCGMGEAEACNKINELCGDGLECAQDLPPGISELNARYYPGICIVKGE